MIKFQQLVSSLLYYNKESIEVNVLRPGTNIIEETIFYPIDINTVNGELFNTYYDYDVFGFNYTTYRNRMKIYLRRPND